MTASKAIKAIEKAGVLLVFPIKNAKEPASLWSALYPRSEMRWDWSDAADPRVVDLWHLKTELSASTDVVYGKWFKGRATFFARDLYAALLRVLGAPELRLESLGTDAAALYQLLLDDSPQTPRMLRASLGLEGRLYETAFNRALRPLWERLLAVGFGEVEEGSYPALAIGSTKNLFEEVWDEATHLSLAEAEEIVARRLPAASPFAAHLAKIRRKL